jgi:hypothetical protein
MIVVCREEKRARKWAAQPLTTAVIAGKGLPPLNILAAASKLDFHPPHHFHRERIHLANLPTMASNPAAELGSILQSASIKRQPSPTHDLNPSTAASQKVPVTVSSDEDVFEADEDEIPASVLRPVPRSTTLPPLPDLRFEQSYLKSIEHAEWWGAVTYITVRDQVCAMTTLEIYLEANCSTQIVLPLVQGVGWSLVVFGWRHWNRASQFSGATLGGRIRKWWWGVNNWQLPDSKHAQSQRLASDVKEVRYRR